MGKVSLLGTDLSYGRNQTGAQEATPASVAGNERITEESSSESVVAPAWGASAQDLNSASFAA